MYLISTNYRTELTTIRKRLEIEKHNSPDVFNDYIEIIDSIITNNDDNHYFYVDSKYQNIISNIYNQLSQHRFDYNSSQIALRNSFIELSQNQPIYLIKKRESKLEFLPQDKYNMGIQVVIFFFLILSCGTILFKINTKNLQEPVSIIAFIVFFVALNVYFIYAIYTFKKESSNKKTLQTLLNIYNNSQLDSKQRERFLNFFLSEFSTSKEKAPFDLDFLKFQKSKN